MVDIESSVIDRVVKAFLEQYPNGSYSGEEITAAPTKWPHLNIIEYDNYDTDYARLESSTVVYDVNVYSNKTSGAKQECRAVLNLVDDAMRTFGKWNRLYARQTKNADSRIYRMSARYRGVAVLESETDGNLLYRIYEQ